MPPAAKRSFDIPDDLWKAEQRTSLSLPVGDAEPAGRVSIEIGSDWIADGSSCLLLVPSVIVPEELNILINPRHADSARLAIGKERRWLYDPRLRA